jgi:hypothetical protein
MKKVFLVASVLMFVAGIGAVSALGQAEGGAGRGGGGGGGFLVGLLALVLVFVSAIMIVAQGQLMLAIREIALNTRREGKDEAEKYQGLLVAAKIIAVAGWIWLGIGGIGSLLLMVGLIQFGF